MGLGIDWDSLSSITLCLTAFPLVQNLILDLHFKVYELGYIMFAFLGNNYLH